MNISDLEPKRSMVSRWKLNLVIIFLFFIMIGITLIIGALNQINKNITSINTACLLTETPTALSVQIKRK